MDKKVDNKFNAVHSKIIFKVTIILIGYLLTIAIIAFIRFNSEIIELFKSKKESDNARQFFMISVTTSVSIVVCVVAMVGVRLFKFEKEKGYRVVK